LVRSRVTVRCTQVEDGVLVLAGERSKEAVHEGGEIKRIERSYGNFERRFRLPTTVKADEVTASLRNGVLHVTVPKSGETPKKHVDIAVSEDEPSGGGAAREKYAH